MTFNFFSLDYIYFPISGIMWVWHKVFGSFMGADNVWAWVLSVVFLIFTIRAILFRPFMKQMDAQLKMQAVQPEMKRLREKYKDDRQRLAEEMMKLNKAAGVNPLAGCLPILVQAPVFIGLFHVLRMFQPVFEGGQWLYRDSVYFFSHQDVLSFSNAKLFGGAPLSAYMTMPADQLEFMEGLRETIIWVGVPLTILAGIATHLTSRRSVARQREVSPDGQITGQAAIMNKLMLWGFPLFVVIGGPFFPLAILFYWLANNTWTFGQLWAAHKIQDRRKAAAAQVVEEAKEQSKFSTPKPGARPQANPKRTTVSPSPVQRSDDEPADGDSTTDSAGSAAGNGAARGREEDPVAGNGGVVDKPGGGSNGAPAKPRPGAKPQSGSGKKSGGSGSRKKRKR